MDGVVSNKAKSGVSAEWLFQMIASLAWFASVIVYGSYELGDCLQLLAASSWSVSNIVSYISTKNSDGGSL